MILFAIDCSESMLELHDDPNYEDVKTSHVLTALEAAMQISKKKVLIGPNDAVGIMLFNTVGNLLCALHIIGHWPVPQTRKNEAGGPGADIKKHNFVFQPIDTVNAPKVQELIQLIDCTWTNPLSQNSFPERQT